MTCQPPMTEPVVIHQGLELGGEGYDDLGPAAATACWAAPHKSVDWARSHAVSSVRLWV
jgi:hypothetical protein